MNILFFTGTKETRAAKPSTGAEFAPTRAADASMFCVMRDESMKKSSDDSVVVCIIIYHGPGYAEYIIRFFYIINRLLTSFHNICFNIFKLEN